MISIVNSKINIGLNVVNKREDGYHDIETVFYPIYSIYDALEIIPNDSLKLTILGADNITSNMNDNILIKAYHLLQKKHPNQIKPIHIILKKNIPIGAGMGGGSADGSFLLKSLNEFFKLNISQAELKDLALILGSDCPFFIDNIPCFAEGRGEKTTPLDLDLNAYDIKIIPSTLHISTVMAFSKISPTKPTFDLKYIHTLPIDKWKSYVVNDFEKEVFSIYPELEKTKLELYNDGAIYASMTGTGSAIYGIFERKVDYFV